MKRIKTILCLASLLTLLSFVSYAQKEINKIFFELVAVMREALGIAPLSIERASLLKSKDKGSHYFVGENY